MTAADRLRMMLMRDKQTHDRQREAARVKGEGGGYQDSWNLPAVRGLQDWHKDADGNLCRSVGCGEGNDA